MAVVLIISLTGCLAKNSNSIEEKNLIISSLKVIDAKTLEVTFNEDELVKIDNFEPRPLREGKNNIKFAYKETVYKKEITYKQSNTDNTKWILKLGDTKENSGFRPSLNDDYSCGDSWGASVLKDDNGIYHMWVSVMANNCSIEYWSRNSYVIHATSTKPEGPYTYVDDAFPVMAHEIDVKRGPDGKWIAFITAGIQDGKLGTSSYGEALNCGENGEPLKQVTGGIDYGASTEATVLLTTDSPYGPWSDPIVLLEPAELLDGIDANFSAVVHEDGSLVGLWRTYPSGSQVHWVTASDYLDPDTYKWQNEEETVFESPYDGFTSEGLEDMFVWFDSDEELYHAIFHDMVVLDKTEFHDGLSHAYSSDGKNWIYTGEAAGTVVNYDTGRTTRSSRARPHLIIEDGEITHLISAEQTPENGRNFTLIEPVIKVKFMR